MKPMRGFAMLKIGETGWVIKEIPACGPSDVICRPLALAPCETKSICRSRKKPDTGSAATGSLWRGSARTAGAVIKRSDSVWKKARRCHRGGYAHSGSSEGRSGISLLHLWTERRSAIL